MEGPGDYVADPTEGIGRIEDFPPPPIVRRSRNSRRRSCPRCGRRAYRLRTAPRMLHDLGDPMSGRPRKLAVISAPPPCRKGNCSFTADLRDLALPHAHDPLRVRPTAVRLGVEDGLPYRTAHGPLGRDPRVFVLFATLPNWGYLDNAFASELSHIYREVRCRYLPCGEIQSLRDDARRAVVAAYRLMTAFIGFPEDLFLWKGGSPACKNENDPRFLKFYKPYIQDHQ